MVCDRVSVDVKEFEKLLNECKSDIIQRSKNEISYLNSEIEKISSYTKEQAIDELIKSKKLREKISVIKAYKNSL